MDKEKSSNFNLTFQALDGVTDQPMEILSWSWGLNYDNEQSNKKEGSKPGLQINELSVTRMQDTESPKLVQTVVENNVIQTAIITTISTNIITTFTLKNVKITSTHMGGSSYGDGTTEVYNLAFESMDMQVTNPAKSITTTGKVFSK